MKEDIVSKTISFIKGQAIKAGHIKALKLRLFLTVAAMQAASCGDCSRYPCGAAVKAPH